MFDFFPIDELFGTGRRRRRKHVTERRAGNKRYIIVTRVPPPAHELVEDRLMKALWYIPLTVMLYGTGLALTESFYSAKPSPIPPPVKTHTLSITLSPTVTLQSTVTSRHLKHTVTVNIVSTVGETVSIVKWRGYWTHGTVGTSPSYPVNIVNTFTSGTVGTGLSYPLNTVNTSTSGNTFTGLSYPLNTVNIETSGTVGTAKASISIKSS